MFDALVALLLVSVAMPIVVSFLMFIGNATRHDKAEHRKPESHLTRGLMP